MTAMLQGAVIVVIGDLARKCIARYVPCIRRNSGLALLGLFGAAMLTVFELTVLCRSSAAGLLVEPMSSYFYVQLAEGQPVNAKPAKRFHFEDYFLADAEASANAAAEELKRRFPPGSPVDKLLAVFAVDEKERNGSCEVRSNTLVFCRYSYVKADLPSFASGEKPVVDWWVSVRIDEHSRAITDIKVSVRLA